MPLKLYCDRKNAFVLTREPTDTEFLAGMPKPKSHFGRACDRLGIAVIAANSPQAKGRVERNHGVDQDRLVKALRLEGISALEEANRFLWKTYLPKMNGKFSRPAQNSIDPLHSTGDAPNKGGRGSLLCRESGFEKTHAVGI